MMKVKTKLPCPSDRQRSHPKGKIWVSKGKMEYKFQNQNKDYWGWRWSSKEGKKIGYCTNIRRKNLNHKVVVERTSFNLLLNLSWFCLFHDLKARSWNKWLKPDKECKSFHSVIFQYINSFMRMKQCLIKLKLFKSATAHQIHF